MNSWKSWSNSNKPRKSGEKHRKDTRDTTSAVFQNLQVREVGKLIFSSNHSNSKGCTVCLCCKSQLVSERWTRSFFLGWKRTIFGKKINFEVNGLKRQEVVEKIASVYQTLVICCLQSPALSACVPQEGRPKRHPKPTVFPPPMMLGWCHQVAFDLTGSDGSFRRLIDLWWNSQKL